MLFCKQNLLFIGEKNFSPKKHFFVKNSVSANLSVTKMGSFGFALQIQFLCGLPPTVGFKKRTFNVIFVKNHQKMHIYAILPILPRI